MWRVARNVENGHGYGVVILVEQIMNGRVLIVSMQRAPSVKLLIF